MKVIYDEEMDSTLSIGEDGMAIIFDYAKKFVINCLLIINSSLAK